MDVESFGVTLSRLARPEAILEIGAGDGHVCEVLSGVYPTASILGIDIADEPGRLFKGPEGRVVFRQIPAHQLTEDGAVFDMVVINDVLHHVPGRERDGLVTTAWELTANDGVLVIKDWIRTRTPATLFAYLSDRFITGDRVVFFPDRESFISLLEKNCPGGLPVAEGSVPPRRNNLYVALRKGSV